MEFAQHTLSFSRENLLDPSTSNGSNENNSRARSTSPTPTSATDLVMDDLSEQLRRQKMSEVLNSTSGAAGNDGGGGGRARILAFAKKAPAAEEGHLNNLKVNFIKED